MHDYLFDTHTHLEHQLFAPDREEILQECIQCLSGWINIGSDLKSSLTALDYARKYPCSWASVGIHPHDAEKSAADLNSIRHLLKQQKTVAVGEIGLDYHYEFSPVPTQIDVLKEQIRMARDHSLPAVFHVREAFADFFQIVDKENFYNGVIHCFSGTEKDAQAALERGFYISLNGILTFPKSTQERAIAKSFPLEKILLETDCPYLSPVPVRKHRNKPPYVIHVASCLAEIKNLSLKEICRQTKDNAFHLFQLLESPGFSS